MITREAIWSTTCLFITFLLMTSWFCLGSATDVDDSDEEMKADDFRELNKLTQLVADYIEKNRMDDARAESDWRPENPLGAFNSRIERRQSWKSKRPCNLGIFGDSCRIAELDKSMRRKNYLQGGFSPGKRDSLSSSFALDEPESRSIKRSCRVRLGGHCITEAMDRAASQYHYLKSGNSPGRKRRSVEAKSFLKSMRLPALKRSLRVVMENQER